jgi:carbonic anhydrase
VRGAKTSLAAVVNNPNINVNETVLTIPPTEHGHCGSDEPLNVWLEPLTKLLFTEGVHLKDEKDRLLEAVKVNVKKQVENVVNSEPIQSAWKEKQEVDVHGWIYHLDTGKLEDLKCSHRPPQK